MKKVLGILALLSAVFAFTFLLDTPQYLKWKKGDIKNFASVSAGELKKGDLVQGTFDECWGLVAEQEESNTVFGIKTSSRTTKKYYCLYNANSDTCFLYETGNSHDYSTLQTMMEETAAYYESYETYLETGDANDLVLLDTTLSFTGAVDEISGELMGIYQEWYGEDFNTDCETVLITFSNYDRFNWVIYAGAGCAALAVILLVAIIVITIKEKRNQASGY